MGWGICDAADAGRQADDGLCEKSKVSAVPPCGTRPAVNLAGLDEQRLGSDGK
jgi:hypothetical protein